jgi:amino acid transporter
MSAETPDDDQLRQLGYRPTFERSMNVWASFALGFTDLSPVVGVYTLFSFSLAAGGAAFFWSYPLVGAGQFLVCLVFCEVAAQYPIAGGLLPWARRLAGARWGWLTGWIYLWALCITIAAVALGAAPYFAALAGAPSGAVTSAGVALTLLALCTLLNLSGTRWLSRLVTFGFIAELTGALAVGAYLLAFARVQPLSVLFDTFDIKIGGSYWPAFLAAAMAGIFQFYGFEACADLAEEVPDPSRHVPQAMRMAMYVGGAAAMFSCLALILATPDIRKVVAGEAKDAVGAILLQAFGPAGANAVIAVICLAFLSCILSVQAAASRLLFSFGRERLIAGSAWFSRTSEHGGGQKNHAGVPVAALIACGIAPAVFVLIGLLFKDALTAIVGFAVIGIYIAFQMVVGGALMARWRGWRPAGAFTLGMFGLPVTLTALAYGLAAILNIAWPQNSGAGWPTDYAVLLSTAVVLALGLLYMAIARIG